VPPSATPAVVPAHPPAAAAGPIDLTGVGRLLTATS